jgi:SAM-dependent methyltransferase
MNVRLKTFLKKFISFYRGRQIKSLLCLPKDLLDLLNPGRDRLIPPTRIMWDGPPTAESFKENGQEFLKHFIQLANLQPDQSVLDIGSGVGRKAVALTQYLNQKGNYKGLDVFKPGILWCQKAISSRFPNFQFQHVDLYNENYNPHGKKSAAEYQLPFPDETFDLVLCLSIFTLIFPDDMENYIKEISRVLKKGGKVFVTYFLYNREAQNLMDSGQSSLLFKFQDPSKRFWSENSEVNEGLLCYEESYLIDFFDKNQLRSQVIYGSWCGRSGSDLEDFVIAQKP